MSPGSPLHPATPDPWPPPGRRRVAALFGCLFLLLFVAGVAYLLVFGLPHALRSPPEAVPVSPLQPVRG